MLRFDLGRTKLCVYLSDREIPLVYNGEPPPKGKKILTVENYMKWYDVYVIDSNGEAFKFDAPGNLIELWDHIPVPGQLEALEDTKDTDGDVLLIDSEAMDMITGRFLRENRRKSFDRDGQLVDGFDWLEK